MKASIVVAFLLAGLTSSTARTEPRVEHRDRVPYDQRLKPPPPRPVGEWVRIVTPTPTKYGTEWCSIGQHAGAFRALRIEAISGTVELRRVVVTYTTGKVATFNVDQTLTLRHPSARIDLGTTRPIELIAVTTSRVPAGVYVVFGERAQAKPELIAQH